MCDTNSVPRYGHEFQEIGHCGGRFTVNVETTEDGERALQFGVTHSSPRPASLFAVYVLPPGLPVGTMQLGGIGTPHNPPPISDCLPVFIASDTHGMFGHKCPKCEGYWRSKRAPDRGRITCPYCGLRAKIHTFLTKGQKLYIGAWCELIDKAVRSPDDGEHVLNMDAVADAVGRVGEKPRFYYAEESQQNKYTCSACGECNDILGRYGYCSSCGTHNGLQELEVDVNSIRKRIGTSEEYTACAKDAVAAFDSFARQIAKHLIQRIPMTTKRRDEWQRKLFHNLKPRAEELHADFDINIFKALKSEDADFAILMFHRRHVYEHNGGEVDEKYIHYSGDNSVRIKQVIRETRETATRIAHVVLQMGKNIHQGFHDIFPPEESPIRMQQEYLERMRRRRRE